MTRYGTLIVDPAWRYRNVVVNGGAEGHYREEAETGRSTMSIEDICALPVRSLALDDAVLFLWATWPLLEDAFLVVAHWGFEFVTGFPWIKIEGEPQRDLFGETILTPQYGTGWWVRGCSEAVLICRRGNPPALRSNYVGLLSENFGHSRKPENLYQLAELHGGPRLEMFARRRRAGWDAWGNEVEGSIALPGGPS